MSLIYTEDQKELIEMVRNMAEKEIKPHVAECDEKGECPVELFEPAMDIEPTFWKSRRNTAEKA